MNNPGTQDTDIQGILGRYLNLRNSGRRGAVSNAGHLDDDSLAAFVDGNLSEREARPMLRHLVDCSFCRHVTAELVRLDMAFADAPKAMPVTEANPSKVSEVLSGLLSKIFGTNDGAVFAHHDTDDPGEKPEDEEKEKSE